MPKAARNADDIIDLSHPITPGMQVFPGDPAVELTAVCDVARDGFRVSSIHLGTHTGTHVDAPSHRVPEGASIDRVSLSRFHGPARIIRVRHPIAAAPIGLPDVEDQLSRVREGEIVLFDTGWSRYFGSPRYFEHPYLAAPIAEFLLVRGVRSVGMDMASPDDTTNEAMPARLPFHERFLGAGGVIFENLTNLESIAGPVTGFSAFPLRIDGGDGSPVRAVAFTSGR